MEVFNKLTYLPFANHYFINKTTNEIFKITNGRRIKKVDVIIKNKIPYVMLSWINGTGYYELSFVILIGNMDIPYPPWVCKRIRTKYIVDNDFYNLKNIIMYFDKPIEDLLYKDFYYVPYYPTILISRNGEVFNRRIYKLHSHIHTQPSVTLKEVKHIKGGYVSVRATDLQGVNSTVSLHRLLCVTFHKYNGSYAYDWRKIVVNHKDGNPKNNILTNLEWTTPKLNNIHAIEEGLRLSLKSVLRLDTRTNKISKFKSIADLARITNQTHSKLLRRVKMAHRRYPDGYVYKYDDDSQWHVLENKITTTGSRDFKTSPAIE